MLISESGRNYSNSTNNNSPVSCSAWHADDDEAERLPVLGRSRHLVLWGASLFFFIDAMECSGLEAVVPHGGNLNCAVAALSVLGLENERDGANVNRKRVGRAAGGEG